MIKRLNVIKDFDKQFHSDHKEMNKLMKKAGIPLRYKTIKHGVR